MKRMNDCKTTKYNTNIDGVSGSEEITTMWQKHYFELFNCMKSNFFEVANVDDSEDVTVSP